MKIEILEFYNDPKGQRIAYLDFKVLYTVEKWEIFRNAIVFAKNGKCWINLGSVQRNEKWLPRYERTPNMNEVFAEVIKELKKSEHIT